MPLTSIPRPLSAPDRASGLSSDLAVDREDIAFFDLAPGLVRLEVTVHNRGAAPSRPARMVVNAAPLGAFVHSTAVARLAVPRIPAGASITIQATFRALSRIRRSRLASLPEDPLRRLDPARIRWAGNFDIHIQQAAAERHCAAAVRLKPGATNYALFFVGKGRDSYRFSFQGDGADWLPRLELGLRTAVHAMRGFAAPPAKAIPAQEWTEFQGSQDVLLLIDPPAGVTEGLLAVEVEQRSTQRKALVEFGFGVDTIPPGCFRS